VSVRCSIFASYEGFTGPSVAAGDAGDASKSDASKSDAFYCAAASPRPVFCEDFDRGPINPSWTRDGLGPGTITMDSRIARSLPASRRITVSPIPAASPCQYVREEFALSNRYEESLRLQTDLFIGHVDDLGGVPDPPVAVNNLRLSAPDGSGACDIYMQMGAGASSLFIEPANASAPRQEYTLSAPAPLHRWTTVAIEITQVQAALPLITVTIDGANVLSPLEIPGRLACRQGRFVNVRTGFSCTRGTVDAELHVDNLIVWAR
jgi:hypothetical protein